MSSFLSAHNKHKYSQLCPSRIRIKSNNIASKKTWVGENYPKDFQFVHTKMKHWPKIKCQGRIQAFAWKLALE